MPQYPQKPDLLKTIADLRQRVARLEKSGRNPDELAMFPTSLRTMPYEDSTAFQTSWETVLTPRTATLQLGLVLIGDAVSTTNTGGAWQVVITDALTVVGSGTVPATFSYVFPSLSIDLTPYLSVSPASGVKVQLQVRRTSGATTGGKYGTGGCIGSAPRYARLI
ncbi:hypothetical protein [Streptomyces sp. MI02-7b]|uniref:hypothetical protein n=1 Tax=Streptomyces sp. MI02-7b TaxID=462941 RepID=UPI0029B274FF|nr:hypothetical protein [Streptomyces sp. MI02-7b]MDX3074629.1 hypothetical protein [Streptomyces sp. MI02-7b]